MAFGAGKRVCAGSLHASLIDCTAIGRLMQEFMWNLRNGEEETVDTLGLTTHMLHPLLAIIRPICMYMYRGNTQIFTFPHLHYFVRTKPPKPLLVIMCESVRV